MKPSYFILPVLLLILAGAGCQSVSSADNGSPGKEKPVHVVLLGGVEAAIPGGSGVWSHVTEVQKDMAVTIAPESVYEAVKNIENGEMPVPFVGVTVRTNPQKLGAEEWARQNASISNFAVRTGEIQQATIGGRPGISFAMEGLYVGTTYIATTSDGNFIVMVTDNHSDVPGGMGTAFTQKVIEGVSIP
jgi:hypothetical protein